ncbi:anion permease, partial [Salmonella enterica subsp. enterica serovar Typhimurium]
MAEKKSQGVKWLPFILILVIAAGLWQLTPPSGLSAPAWHSAIIFVATIASIVAKVLPIGAVGIIGITVFALAYAAGDKTASGAITTALSELNS